MTANIIIFISICNHYDVDLYLFNNSILYFVTFDFVTIRIFTKCKRGEEEGK